MRRLAAVARQLAVRIVQVGAVQLADAVVAQAGPGADGLRARLVTQEAQREFHAQAFTVVAVVGNAHGGHPAVRDEPLCWCRPEMQAD